MSLEADLGEAAGAIVCREISIGERTLDTIDYFELIDSRRSDEEISVVNHLYLNRGNVDPSASHPVTINGNELDDVMRERGASQRIIDGEARLWTGFADENSTVIGMPDGSQVEVRADYNGGNVDGALLWAPPGENAFCFEPVMGVEPTPEDNRRLIIPAGGAGILAVSIIAR